MRTAARALRVCPVAAMRALVGVARWRPEPCRLPTASQAVAVRDSRVIFSACPMCSVLAVAAAWARPVPLAREVRMPDEVLVELIPLDATARRTAAAAVAAAAVMVRIGMAVREDRVLSFFAM